MLLSSIKRDWIVFSALTDFINKSFIPDAALIIAISLIAIAVFTP